ncbi:MAG: HisA/HisF family protein [Isosphaeraceae bacterium]
MRLIPVLDLRAGVVVDARGGDRRYYRPAVSNLHEGSDPLAWAKKARDAFGATELYVADLDAIEGSPIAWEPIERLARIVPKLWLDPGARDANGWERLPEQARLVAGTETLNGSAELKTLVERLGPKRTVLSLDLREGRPLVAQGSSWTDPLDPRAIAREAIDQGIEEIVLLDLARVGSNKGTGSLDLLRTLSRQYSLIRWAVGGGISGRSELVELAEAGASAALIGSAWRDGRIKHAEC